MLASTAILPLGSYDFSPEGYAKASFWKPDDSYSWDEFKSQPYDSLEDFERGRIAFEEKARNKTEITDDYYCKRSLRRLLPDRWLLEYTRGKAWTVSDGKKLPLYSQLKSTLLFKSEILGYGSGVIRKLVPHKEAAKYIKEHCASSAHLKAIALRAYESVGNMGGYGVWTPVSPPIFLCLAAAKSSLDAMAAVIWALLFHETPTGMDTPDMGRLLRKTKSTGLFHDEVMRLHKSPWFKRLQIARNQVIHRSAGPIVHDTFGAAFESDLGLFHEMRPNSISVSKPKIGKSKKIARIQLDQVMKGFVIGLESWEKRVARKLKKHAWYSSCNPDGIILGIRFNDHNLLRDGEGPCLMIKSYDPSA